MGTTLHAPRGHLDILLKPSFEIQNPSFEMQNLSISMQIATATGRVITAAAVSQIIFAVEESSLSIAEIIIFYWRIFIVI